MKTVNASMTVIGAGSYGTALAITLARNGHPVVLWGHNPEHINALQRARCNQEFLPDVPFPDNLLLETNLIKRLKPRFNVLMRDDKSFPFIAIRTDHPIAALQKHRGARRACRYRAILPSRPGGRAPRRCVRVRRAPCRGRYTGCPARHRRRAPVR